MSDATTDADIEVDCPGCGLTLVGNSPRPSADWFCPRCDYPLFWVPKPTTEGGSTSRASRRRLPGSGGRSQIGASSCWHCGEMNEPGEAECLRCAATLPKPLAPTVRVVEHVPTPVPVVIRSVVWPFVAAGVCGGAAVAVALTRWLLGVG